MKHFIIGVLPYLTFLILVFGLIYRIRGWYVSKVKYQLNLFPVPNTPTGEILKEIIFFKTLYRFERPLWVMSYGFHLGIFLIVIGHIAGIAFAGHQFTLLGATPEQSEKLSFAFGMLAGTLAFFGALALLLRRLSGQVKQVSDPWDYLDLLLILAIVTTGNAMRTLAPVELSSVKKYFADLFSLRPINYALPGAFVLHYFFGQILLMYLPFSKLLHLAGGLINKAITLTGDGKAKLLQLSKGGGR